MSLKEDIVYEYPIPEEKYEDIIIHLRNNFFADEPLNKTSNLCKRGEPHKGLEDHCFKTLNDNYSIMAYNAKNGEIAGVSLNGIVRKGDYEEELEKLKTITDLKFKYIFTFLYSECKSLDLFTKYGVNEIFETRILSVDNTYRNKGIGRKLLSMTIDLAVKDGFKVLKTDATSKFSQTLADRLGCKTEREILYADYKTDNGEVIFDISNEEPHSSLKIMTKICN